MRSAKTRNTLPHFSLSGEMMNQNKNNNPGCLSGILQLFLVSQIYNWCQETFGAKKGGCCGCLIGAVLFVIMILVVLKIVFNVDWTSISF